MFRTVKAASLTACAVLLGSGVFLAQTSQTQQAPVAQPASTMDKGTSVAHGCFGCELPVILRENVVAGKTAVGTKVEAQLVIATMVKGSGVIPRGALISGEVIESVAKSDKSPSRLAIRMDSAQWKDGGAKFNVYLTAWFYPLALMPPPNLSYDTPGSSRNWGGVDYTDPPNPMSGRRWSQQSNEGNSVNADAPASIISKERVRLKNVESASGADGSVILLSSRSNIKLNKTTTYVLGGNDFLLGK